MDSIFSQKWNDTLVCPDVEILPFPMRVEDVWLVGGILSPVNADVYHALQPEFSKKLYQLQYFPDFISKVSKEALQYNFPGVVPALSDINEIEFRKAVFAALGQTIDPAAGYLIRLDEDEKRYHVTIIPGKKAKDFISSATAFAKELPSLSLKRLVHFSKLLEEARIEAPDDGRVMFSISGGGSSSPSGMARGVSAELPEDVNRSLVRNRIGCEPKRNIDMLSDVVKGVHDDEVLQLAEEVEAKIRELVMADFPVEVIETMLQRAVKLSRVRVTSDWKILLTDYGKEIKMRQLPKTLFLWFLKHRDGCRLKDLQDHRDELLSIYKRLTNQANAAAVVSSIDALVSPIGPSFSEKSAAVKLSFLKEIPERIAKNYYIHGPQGGIKAIDIDRDLVDWEVEI